MRDRSRLLLLVPTALALAIAWAVVRTWAGRLGHPYDLEWMEGGVLAHAWRLLHGQPIYAAPEPTWIPMVYTPGYYGMVAALGSVFGLSPAVGRAVSVFGTLLACGALGYGAWRRLGSPLLGVIGAGVFLATYDSNGAFFDLVRPDALAVGLLAWALVLAAGETRRSVLASGLLLFAAFVVKHNTAALGAPIALGLWARRGWRDALVFALVAAVPGALFTAWMQVTTHGHFLRYVIEVPASHPMVLDRVFPGSARELGHALPAVAVALAAWLLTVGPRRLQGLPVAAHVVPGVLAGLGGAALVRGLPPVDGIPAETAFEGVAAGALLGVGVAVALTGLLAMALARKVDAAFVLGAGVALVVALVAGMMRGHHGGFVNVFMPLHWVVAALFTVMLADVLEALPGWRGAALATLAATLATGTQLAVLELDRLLPEPGDVEAGDQLVAALGEVEGPVLSVFAPWMPVQAGHEPGYHLIALWDINHKDGPYRSAVAGVLKAIRDRRFGAVLDGEPSMGHGVAKVYTDTQRFELPRRALMPRTGWRRRPEVIRLAPAASGDVDRADAGEAGLPAQP